MATVRFKGVILKFFITSIFQWRIWIPVIPSSVSEHNEAIKERWRAWLDANKIRPIQHCVVPWAEERVAGGPGGCGTLRAKEKDSAESRLFHHRVLGIMKRMSGFPLKSDCSSCCARGGGSSSWDGRDYRVTWDKKKKNEVRHGKQSRPMKLAVLMFFCVCIVFKWRSNFLNFKSWDAKQPCAINCTAKACSARTSKWTTPAVLCCVHTFGDYIHYYMQFIIWCLNSYGWIK